MNTKTSPIHSEYKDSRFGVKRLNKIAVSQTSHKPQKYRLAKKFCSGREKAPSENATFHEYFHEVSFKNFSLPDGLYLTHKLCLPEIVMC